jgi:hypothetical protein
LVSQKETGDEVVLTFKIFYPSVFDFFLRNQIHLPLKKGKELFVGLIFIIGIIIIFTCPLNSSPLKGYGVPTNIFYKFSYKYLPQIHKFLLLPKPPSLQRLGIRVIFSAFLTFNK